MSSISLFQVFPAFHSPLPHSHSTTTLVMRLSIFLALAAAFISPATAIAPKPYLRPINSKQQTALAPALSNTQAVSSADAVAGVATRGGSAASG